MKKIAFIVQRYGLEVNGGAEYHCRLLAEKLQGEFCVEVLTSCATDYGTWVNEYPEGITRLNGVTIRRFPALQERNQKKAKLALRKMRLNKIFPFYRNVRLLGDEWSKQQGPYLPGLIEYLKQHASQYDALIFFTYLYYPTFQGLRIAPHKSILIPTAHDESAIRLEVFREFFKLPKVILYNTSSEQKLLHRLFGQMEMYTDVVGVGIDQPMKEQANSPADLLGFDAPYLIYIGRIEAGKGSDLMLDYFLQYKRIVDNDLKLVLVGKAFMDIPVHPDIIPMGFVTEGLKYTLLRGASALIMPSHYESLSMVTLESMLEGIPVIANERCEVLKDHIHVSKGGYTFANFTDFESALEAVMTEGKALLTMKNNAKRYVQDHYNWQLILKKIRRALEVVST